MIRGAWFLAGACVGVYAVIKARRTAEALTPDGIRDRIAGLGLGARLFGEEVRVGMVEREAELRERLGLDRAGPPELPARAASTEPDGRDELEGSH